jgi:hypothetical protein
MFRPIGIHPAYWLLYRWFFGAYMSFGHALSLAGEKALRLMIFS